MVSPIKTELTVEVISLSSSWRDRSPRGSVNGASRKNVSATVRSAFMPGSSPAPMISLNSSPAICSLMNRSYGLSRLSESMT